MGHFASRIRTHIMKRKLKIISSIAFATSILLIQTGCASIHYASTETGKLSGKLSGKLTVQWIKPDEFIFIPDKEKPLTFERHNKDTITPGVMHTDGGSIPQPLRSIKNYSPWGYAPAFIIHDWLFEMKHCNIPGGEKYTYHEAATIMSEIIKTMMESGNRVSKNKLTMYSMHKAVDSKIAANLWNNGKCDQPTSHSITNSTTPLMEYTIEYP